MLLGFFRHLVNHILWILPPTRLFQLRRMLLKAVGISVGSDVHLCGRSWIYGRGKLTIGEGTWVSPGALFYTHPDAEIRIGTNCDVGPDCSFVTGSHNIGNGERRAGEGYAAPITIGNGVWIGSRSLLLPGTTVGSSSIVAAGAVVTVDLPADVLAAGVPAVIKRSLSECQ